MPLPGASDKTAGPEHRQRPKITKKQNARMQLAAALIEADNDSLEERARRAAALAAQVASEGPDDEPVPLPPPPPQPKLASESVIFAPFRISDDDAPAGPSVTTARARSIQRPTSRDFLGVSLPGEGQQRSGSPTVQTDHLRNRSVTSSRRSEHFAGPSSRPGTALSLVRTQSALSRPDSPGGRSQQSRLDSARVSTIYGGHEDPQGDDDDEAELDEWGLDKFLSSEARRKISEKRHDRQRALSTPNGALDLQDDPADRFPTNGPRDRLRRDSELSTQSLAKLRRSPSPAGSLSGSIVKRAKSDIVAPGGSSDRSTTLDLLARIKLYRERQENLPPSQWGPDVAGSDTAVETARPPTTLGVSELNEGVEEIARADSPLTRPPSVAQSQSGVYPSTGGFHFPPLDVEVREGRVKQRPPVLTPEEVDDGLHRRESSKGYLGDSWSEQGSELSHATSGSKLRNISGNRFSALPTPLEPTAEESFSVGADETVRDLPRSESMAGVGSFQKRQQFDRIDETSTGQRQQDGGEGHRRIPTSPLVPRPLTPGTPKALTALTDLNRLADVDCDVYAPFPLGPSRYPTINPSPSDAALYDPSPQQFNNWMSPHPVRSLPSSGELAVPGAGLQAEGSPVMRSNAGLSTRQLQALARQSAFPEHYGIITPMLLSEKEEEEARQREIEEAVASGAYGYEELARVNSIPTDGWVPERTPGLFSKAFKSSKIGLFSLEGLKADIEKSEPDLSSARWGKKRRKSLGTSFARIDSSLVGRDTGAEQSLEAQASNAISARPDGNEFQDDEMAALEEPQWPAVSGREDQTETQAAPLKRKGIEAFLPEILIMPALLEGSAAQPRSRLSEQEQAPMTPEKSSRRQSGLYVPDGFVLHSGKSLPPIQRTTEGGRSRLAFVYPAAAPEGIGRRAMMSSTALFRNQLVQHEEEREGWGWEVSTAARLDVVEEAGEEVPAPTKRQLRKAQKAASKEAKARYKRKRARALRRRRRAEAVRDGKKCTDYGVPEESPAEDLSLTEDSEGDLTDSDEDGTDDGISWHSEDEKRWVDESKPAGKLFGKSLMDVAEEKRLQRTTNRRFYGQQELQEMDDNEKAEALLGAGHAMDGRSVLAPSTAARSFADNPVGYNDTRERMQAAFGHDVNWAREMQKRREIEAQEAEIRRLAEEEYARELAEKQKRKEAKLRSRGLFKKGRKHAKDSHHPAGQDTPGRVEADMSLGSQQTDSLNTEPIDAIGPADRPGVPQDTGSVDDHMRSQTPIEPPQLEIPLPSTSGPMQRRAGHLGVDEWLLPSSDESDSDSQSDASLRKRAYERARLSRSMGAGGMSELPKLQVAGVEADSSDDDHVPLSQLKRSPLATSKQNVVQNKAFPDSSDEDEGLTLADLKRLSLAKRASGLHQGAVPRLNLLAEESSDEEVSLAQLKSKRLQSRQSLALSAFGGLNGASGAPAEASMSETLGQQPQEQSDSDEDRPLGLRQGAAAALAEALEAQKQALREQRRQSRKAQKTVSTAFDRVPDSVEDPVQGEESDANKGDDPSSSSSDEDRPLGAAHPQAAIIARQAAMIKKLQAEAEHNRMHLQQPFASPFPHSPSGPFGPSMGMTTPMMPSSHHMSMMFPPQASSLAFPLGGSASFSQLMPPEPSLFNGFSGAPAMSASMGGPDAQVPMIALASPSLHQGDAMALPPHAMTGAGTPLLADAPSVFLAPKEQTIDRWRNAVLPPSIETSAAASTTSRRTDESSRSPARAAVK
ncbi:unnamed protein product [Parajaminaea phylloscopi]